MFKEGMRKKMAMLLVLLMALSSLSVVFAEGEKEEKKTLKMQNVFQEAYKDEVVQNAAVEITKPIAKLISIGFTIFGIILVAGVFYFGGKDFWATLAGHGNMSKGRCGVLLFGLALGGLFFTGGIFDTIGITDRVIVKMIESILNS